jgi:hypothetical protein
MAELVLLPIAVGLDVALELAFWMVAWKEKGFEQTSMNEVLFPRMQDWCLLQQPDQTSRLGR